MENKKNNIKIKINKESLKELIKKDIISKEVDLNKVIDCFNYSKNIKSEENIEIKSEVELLRRIRDRFILKWKQQINDYDNLNKKRKEYISKLKNKSFKGKKECELEREKDYIESVLKDFPKCAFDDEKMIDDNRKVSEKEMIRCFENFIVWWANNYSKDEGPKCHYCETSEKEYKRIYDNSNDVYECYVEGKLHKSKKVSFNSEYMEIDKMDSLKGYTSSNCVFACHLCNNAKSDLINSKDFEETIGKNGIRKYVEYLLNKINNDEKII